MIRTIRYIDTVLWSPKVWTIEIQSGTIQYLSSINLKGSSCHFGQLLILIGQL